MLEKTENQYTPGMLHKITESEKESMKPTDAAYKNLSCQYITEALFRLMETEHFEEITISQITQEAGIARRTFYLNFTSKTDILDQHYDLLMKEYDDDLTPEIENSFEKQAVYFFSFWQRHKSYALLLEKNGMFHMLMNRFRFYLNRTPNYIYDSFDETEQGYALASLSGTLWMMLGEWMKRNFKETPEEVAAIFLKVSSFSRENDRR